MPAKSRKKSAKKSPRRSSRRAEPRTLLGKLVKWGFVAGMWLAIILGVLTAWYATELPDITEAMVFERRPTIIIKADDGTILDRYGDIKGESVTVEDLPAHVVYAILATEDRRFYQHGGIDPVGIARAFAVNLVHMRFVQGGSTITQQLAKNLFLSRDRTLKRKIQEAMLALWLERKLTKDEILSAYLNRVYLGAGAYGIDAAAKVYFNKSARFLSLREAATIAGLLKAPSRYSPASDPVASAQRTQVVLNAMVDAGFIEKAEINKLESLPPSPRRKPSSGDTVRYFTDYIVGQLEDLIGPVEKDLIVETTLDPEIQAEAEEAMTRFLLEYATAHNIGQGAMVAMRLNGAIVAMLGGRDYSVSEFNRATHSLRQPGSSFKPFVYLTALEQGWKITDTVVDEPITEGKYRPQNYGGEYFGEVSLYEALTRSLNTVAYTLIRAVGPEEVVGMARRLGITAVLEPNLSLALGTNGISVLEMTAAYAALGRGGLAVEPFSIKRITDVEGTVYYERERRATARQVVDRRNVEDLTVMMESVIQNGTGQAARVPFMAAGKTGTSQDFRDAWFIGFTQRYAAAVWVGNDDNTPMKRVTGGLVPARVWRDVMLTAHNQSGGSENYYSTVSGGSDFGFHDLISRLLAGGSGNDGGGDSVGSGIRWRSPRTVEEEYTPLGRHQWELND